MFLALVHVRARAHAPLDQPQGGGQRAFNSQSFHERPAGIAHYLGQFDQAALRILPGEQDDQLVLEERPDQFGVQFTQRAPRVTGVPFVDLAVLFPEFVEHLNGVEGWR